MTKLNTNKSQDLAEHFFRTEYGKMVSVIAGYLGTEHVQTAEDIVQETLLKAVNHWQHRGIPENAQAWLYTTAKNLVRNIQKRKSYHHNFEEFTRYPSFSSSSESEIQFSDDIISDQQLKMMFACCHPNISQSTQISLILKILCGFSISEIASAFLTSKETINKRLVRGRKQLRDIHVQFDLPKKLDDRLPTVLKTVFLLFNEGYNPTLKNEVVRYDLCIEAIRLVELMLESPILQMKSECNALLALMYLNGSRFDARMNSSQEVIEMDQQNRMNWNQDMISQGIKYLNLATEKKQISAYLILATISANHCVAPNFALTNWTEILDLYTSLLTFEDSPLVRLNRAVALAKVKGNAVGIEELESLKATSDIEKNYLYHSTLAALYKEEGMLENAIKSYEKAILLAQNERDKNVLKRKLIKVVPVF